jgi:hypothetical protein
VNLTLSLLAGLFLLLPGLTALVGWNAQGSRQGAKRPELQLTSATALFIALGIATVLHILGFGLTHLLWSAAVQAGGLMPADLPLRPVAENPYEMAVRLAFAAPGESRPGDGTIIAFLVTTLVECLLAWRLVGSEGLDLATDGVDLRSQGWVYEHYTRPVQHGYKPVAYVLTTSASGEYGIGYEGVVADLRQGDNGELKMVSLAEPQRFVYQLVPAKDRPRRKPRLETYSREWLGGIVTLDASVVRNIVIHNIPAEAIAEVDAVPIAPDEALPEGVE